MKRRQVLAVAALVVGLPQAVAQSDWRRVAVPVYGPQDLVRGVIVHAHLPRAQAFAAAAAALVEALRSGCGAPARERWREAMLAWSGLNAVAIGPLLQRRSVRRIDFQPARPALIEQAIVRAPQNEADMERIGSAAKGFGALEALLWRPTADAAACAYALQVALDIQREADALAAGFAALREADDEALTALFPEVLNQWIGGLEQLRLQGIERPLIEARHRGRAVAFPRGLSGSDAAERAARWSSLRALAVFEGGTVPAPGAGLVPWETFLRGRGLNPLADRLRRSALQADAALRAAGAATPPLRTASRRLAELKTLAEAELAPAVDVRVGFSDADGD
ncbi:imelysin family protein [Variovorax sp. YR752]|uniref:imelysin family protein n=1 Tax=Variovorax sp. YR752 TaxID=1884383 RepID=UPI003137BD5E